MGVDFKVQTKLSMVPVGSSNYWNMVVDPNPDGVHRDKYNKVRIRNGTVFKGNRGSRIYAE